MSQDELSQLVVEIAQTIGEPTVQTSQVAVEIARDLPYRLDASQVVVEVAHEGAEEFKVSQTIVEIGYEPTAWSMLSQVVIEIARRYGIFTSMVAMGNIEGEGIMTYGTQFGGEV